MTPVLADGINVFTHLSASILENTFLGARQVEATRFASFVVAFAVGGIEQIARTLTRRRAAIGTAEIGAARLPRRVATSLFVNKNGKIGLHTASEQNGRRSPLFAERAFFRFVTTRILQKR